MFATNAQPCELYVTLMPHHIGVITWRNNKINDVKLE